MTSRIPVVEQITRANDHVAEINRQRLDASDVIALNIIRRGVQALNADLETFELSCRTGKGVEPWVTWVRERVAAAPALASRPT